MKKNFVGIFVLTTLVSAVGYAGPVEPQQQTYQPQAQWYRNQEWNFDLFGAYAFTSRPYQSDRFLGVDHAWGGGMDANYIFGRYFGIGVEGYGLAADDAVGQASGNLIFRYPIPGTRFAPYVYAGGGVIFRSNDVEDLVDREDHVHHQDTEGMGQFGGGFEVRITPNFGVISDFDWNVLTGNRDDFGMVRSGLRFAF